MFSLWLYNYCNNWNDRLVITWLGITINSFTIVYICFLHNIRKDQLMRMWLEHLHNLVFFCLFGLIIRVSTGPRSICIRGARNYTVMIEISYPMHLLENLKLKIFFAFMYWWPFPKLSSSQSTFSVKPQHPCKKKISRGSTFLRINWHYLGECLALEDNTTQMWWSLCHQISRNAVGDRLTRTLCSKPYIIVFWDSEEPWL